MRDRPGLSALTTTLPGRLLALGASVPFLWYGPRAVVVGLVVAVSTAVLGGYFVGVSQSGACGRCGIDWNALAVVGLSGVVLATFPKRVAIRLMVIFSMTLWAAASVGTHVTSAGIVRANEARLPECVDGERSFYVVPGSGPGGRSRVVPDCIVKLPTALGLNGPDWSVAVMAFAAAAGLWLGALELLAGFAVVASVVKLRRTKASRALDTDAA